MTRILHAVHAFAPEPTGGTERHVSGLASAQLARGHEPIVVAGTLRWRARVEETEADHAGLRVLRLHRDDFHYERWHKGYHPEVSQRFDAILGRERPDVVHVHHWLRLTLDLAQRARARGIPVVVSLHDSYATCPTIHRVLPDGTVCQTPASAAACGGCLGAEYPDFADLDADALRLRQEMLLGELGAASRVLALSQSQADRMAPLLPGLRVDVQPFTSFQRLAPSPLPPPPPPLHVACMGHLNPGKAQHALLEAVRGLPRPRDVVVHLFGEIHPASYAARLRELAAGLDVVWHGRYEYAQVEATPLHLVALTSTLPETYGLVLDEARMLGVPVVATDRGAYRERIGRGGVLVPAGDVAALRDALGRLLAEPSTLQALREGVTAPPDGAGLVDFFERVYADALVDGPRVSVPSWTVDRVLHDFHRADRLERLVHRLSDRHGEPR